MKQKVISVFIAVLFFVSVIGLLAVPVTSAVTKDEESIPVAVFMYHHVTEKSSYWGRDSISPAELEKDLQTLTSYGYTTVHLSQVIDYVNGKGNLPLKAAVLTFDDGFLNYRDVVVPLLEKYHCCATLAVVGEYADKAESRITNNPNFEYMTWTEIGSLNPRVTEIAYHSYSSHFWNGPTDGRRGMKAIAGESDGNYRTYLTKEWNLFSEQAAKHGFTCSVTAYPFGSYSDSSDEILSSLGVKATLTCESGVNRITRGDTSVLWGLKRINRPHGVDSETLMKKYLSQQ